MTIIIIITLILIILNLSIFIFNKSRLSDSIDKKFNKFTIIIASKNEGLNIKNLIESLKKINYPKEDFEVIFVDDNSKDDTKLIILNQIKNISNMFYLLAKAKNYNGKKGAIDAGINASKFDNIVITDSDCIVNPNWLIEINKQINSKAEFIIGISPFIQNNNIINKVACFENLRTIILTIVSVNLKLPYTAVARNLCFKKSFYEKINGFSKLQDTLSGDDDLLLREAINNKANIQIMQANDSYVYSTTKSTYAAFINQKFRHTSTSYHYSVRQSIFPAIWHLINLIIFLTPTLSFINLYYLIPFFVKILFDIFVILLKQKTFNYKFGIFEIIYLQFLYELLIVFKFPFSYFYKKRW